MPVERLTLLVPLVIIGLGRNDGGAANGCEVGCPCEKLPEAAGSTAPESDDSDIFSASLPASTRRLRPLELAVPGRVTDGLSAPMKRPTLVARGGEDDGMMGL